MIEIIFDRNPDDVFLNEKRPVFVAEKHITNWNEYRKQAKEILAKYKNERIVIIRNAGENVSINWLAVALFAESCFVRSETEAVVFKAENYEKAVAAYKPFVALSIGIKYAVRLYQEDLKNMYKDIAGLSYLGLSIKEDFLRNKLIVKFDKAGEVKKMQASTAEEALTAIGIIKSMLLAGVTLPVEGEFDMIEKPSQVDIDKVIDGIVQSMAPLLESI